MQYRTLGGTGLNISEVGFGSWAIGGPSRLGELEIGWGEVDDEVSIRSLHAALDAGINFFDTADVYGNGHSEEVIGKAFAGKRDQVIIASKVGNRTLPNGEWKKDFSPEWVREAVDHSLRRLQTDTIDLYQLHSASDPADYSDEVFAALEEIKQAGKIRFYGVSVGPTEHGPRLIRQGKGDTIQVVYNILGREPEDELLGLAEQENVGIIARVPLASGFLTGKYDENTTFPENDHRQRRYPPERIRELVGEVGKLAFLTADTDKTLAQASLQYCLSHPAVSCVIPGAKTPEQVRDNAAASDGVLLTAEEAEKVRTSVLGDACNYGPTIRRDR